MTSSVDSQPLEPDLEPELDARTSSADSDSRWAIETLLARGEPVWLTARGNSMRPLIAPGARVQVQPTSFDALRAGDVALCKVGERLVLHRICRLRPDAVWLLGDNQRVPQPLAPAQVVGRLVHGAGPVPLFDALPLLDTLQGFRRLGAGRVPAARLLNLAWRALVVTSRPALRVRRRIRGR